MEKCPYCEEPSYGFICCPNCDTQIYPECYNSIDYDDIEEDM